MGSGNLVTMGPTVVFQIWGASFSRRRFTIATVLIAIFFNQHNIFFERLCLLFQLLGQTRIGFSECCHYTKIHSSVRGQVCKCSKGFSEIMFRLSYSNIFVPGGCGYFLMHLTVLIVGCGKVNPEIFPTLVCFHFSSHIWQALLKITVVRILVYTAVSLCA